MRQHHALRVVLNWLVSKTFRYEDADLSGFVFIVNVERQQPTMLAK